MSLKKGMTKWLLLPLRRYRARGLCLLAVSALLPGMPSWSQAPPSQAAGYRLVFSDTFSPLGLGTTNAPGYNWYYPGLYNFGAIGTVTNPAGYANLNWVTSQNYTTDMSTLAMNGAYGRSWTYGYFEVSMAFNPVTGNWPAVWLQMANYNINSIQTGPEIDIFEWQSSVSGSGTTGLGFSTYHTWNNGTDLANNSGSNSWSVGSANLNNYNTYGVLWTNTSLSFYFNNALVETVSTKGSPLNSYFAGQYPVFMVLQESAGCNWTLNQYSACPGQVSPLNMQVQWVHVFQPPASALTGASLSGGRKS